MPLLFSYGTLQHPDVQQSIFGRLLSGGADRLVGFAPASIPIKDPDVVSSTGATHHAKVVFTGRPESEVTGTAFEVTDPELEAADRYEEDADYGRVVVTLASGREAWVYLHAIGPRPGGAHSASTARGIAAALSAEIARALPLLRRLSDADAARSRGAGKWSRAEILGHLIDSASNNHQRFIRAQQAAPFVWAGYEQDVWVVLNGYSERPWMDLVELWAALNRHLVHVMTRVSAEALATTCTIGDHEPVTLEWLMQDYVTHLRHHLDQIAEQVQRA